MEIPVSTGVPVQLLLVRQRIGIGRFVNNNFFYVDCIQLEEFQKQNLNQVIRVGTKS